MLPYVCGACYLLYRAAFSLRRTKTLICEVYKQCQIAGTVLFTLYQ